MSYMRQVITGLPEATMDNEEQWERSLAAGKSKFRKLTIVITIADPYVERWWVSVQDVAQDTGPPFTGLLTQMCRGGLRAGAAGAIVGSVLVKTVADHLNDPEAAPYYLEKTITVLKQASRQRPS